MTYSQPQPPVPPRQPAGMSMVAPQSIKNAVWAMYAGAALSLINLIAGLATKNSVMDAYRQTLIDDGNTLAQINDKVDTASNFVTSSAWSQILWALLWIAMALANGKGKGWARIVATVLFAINTIGTIFSFFGSPRPHGISLAINVLTWLAGLAAIYFLYRRESSDYINRATT